ncbi:MAG: hypothetical protein J0H68_02060 [Sphingobacteriia bacterium]|nr:hypothetical protein [Sphingobacteriia bacterium]
MRVQIEVVKEYDDLLTYFKNVIDIAKYIKTFMEEKGYKYDNGIEYSLTNGPNADYCLLSKNCNSILLEFYQDDPIMIHTQLGVFYIAHKSIATPSEISYYRTDNTKKAKIDNGNYNLGSTLILKEVKDYRSEKEKAFCTLMSISNFKGVDIPHYEQSIIKLTSLDKELVNGMWEKLKPELQAYYSNETIITKSK